MQNAKVMHENNDADRSDNHPASDALKYMNAVIIGRERYNGLTESETENGIFCGFSTVSKILIVNSTSLITTLRRSHYLRQPNVGNRLCNF